MCQHNYETTQVDRDVIMVRCTDCELAFYDKVGAPT